MTGLAVVYGQTADVGPFMERIESGALRSVLTSGRNMRLLFEHDRRGLLASTEAQSLRVFDSPEGLRFEGTIAETTTGDDVLVLIRGKELRGCSFAFRVADDGEVFTRENGKLTRIISEFSEVPELTLTSFPVYDQTSIAQRSISPEAIAQAERIAAMPTIEQRRRQLRAAQAAA